MGKIMEWLKNNWLVAGIAVLLVAALTIFVVIIMSWGGAVSLEGKTSVGDLLRTLILCVGGIGAAIGLGIAIKRQETFSHQGFNDRLGRGVESLASDNVVIRSAGVRVLIDLIDSASDKQKSIIANIIYDFFRDKLKIQYDDNNEPLPVPEMASRQDAQNALDFLINLTLEEREKLFQEQIFGGLLDFRNLDFSNLSIVDKAVKNVDFSNSHIVDFMFYGVNFENVEFCNAKIRNSDFRYGSIVDSKFASSVIKDSDFAGIDIERADFSDIEIINTEFNLVRFIGGRFWGKNKIKVSSQNGLPKFICTELRYTEFDFSDKSYPDTFFNLCYYAEGQRPSNLDKSREYKLTMGGNIIDGTMGGNIMDGVGFFVKSDEPWSGQSMRERVAVELATIKLEIAEDRRATIAHPIDASAEDIIEADKKVSAAKKELQAAQECLKKFQTP